MMPLSILRAPPFPWADASVSDFSSAPPFPADAPKADAAKLFGLVCEARVGGRFWADPAILGKPVEIVIRPRDIGDLATRLEALTASDRKNVLWIAPSSSQSLKRELNRLVTEGNGVWRGDVDPWSVLPGARTLLAHGDDEWVALARIAGVPVQVLSQGRFGAPGDNSTKLDELVAEDIASTAWRDPFSGESSTIEAVVDLLAMWRSILAGNRSIIAACGMAWWKRPEIRRFLWHPQRRLRLVSSPKRALSLAAKSGGAVAIWPSRVSPGLIAKAQQKGTVLVRVEDGFVRSAGLGVDLVPPSSVVVDHSGIHFDPSGASDLETLLNDTQPSPRLLERAQSLRQTIVAAGISKYAAGKLSAFPERQPGRRLVLVPAQVEDDMSVLAGGCGLTSNLELLRRVRAMEPEAEIWFRPHPDVDAGHRKGAVPDGEVLAFADRIIRGGSMAPLLNVVDAVHVLTSLTGFEALLRGREVICHGIPFYAGWGLTQDLGPSTHRRMQALSLDALVAGVLILYPRYLDPVTGLPCPPEVLVRRMANADKTNRLAWIAPLRGWQGRLMAALRKR